MSYYWAKFEKRKNSFFRFETRVYLNSIKKPSDDDFCIGVVVGKNPGSALPFCHESTTLQKIVLDNDRLLPNIRSIFQKAYKRSNKLISKNSYIQVLNLLYVCDKKVSQAIKRVEDYQDPIICDTEKKHFPFLWYVWGGSNEKLNIYKHRYENINADIHFYYNVDTGMIVDKAPGLKNWARHTQGLSHELVVPYISNMISNLLWLKIF